MTYFLAPKGWVPAPCDAPKNRMATETTANSGADIATRLEALAHQKQQIHERDCFNLNPATNVVNLCAEALLSADMGSRASLGYPVTNTKWV